MFKNFIKVTLRNIAKNKFNSILNIFGLSLGMVCFILIALYVMDELSYDRYHKNAENIFRVVKKIDTGKGPTKHEAFCPSPLATKLKFEYPDIVKGQPGDRPV